MPRLTQLGWACSARKRFTSFQYYGWPMRVAFLLASAWTLAAEPEATETTIELSIPAAHSFRTIILGPAFKISTNGGEPRWEWAYSEEQFKADQEALAAKRKKDPKEEKPCTLKLWWPEGVKIRGCFYSTAWGPYGRAQFKGDRSVQQFCRENGLALVGFQGLQIEWGFYPRAVFDEAIRKLGEKAGHPELSQLPFVVFGFSNGSLFATGCAMLYPERCIAWCAGHSNMSKHFLIPNLERSMGLAVHGMNDVYLTGGPPNPKDPTPEQDPLITRNRDDAVALLRAERNTPVAMAMHPSVGHAMNMQVMMDFLATAIKLRNPRQNDKGDWILDPIHLEDGWLGQRYNREKGGPQTLEIKPYNDVPEADRKNWNWLPTEEFARKWQAYSNTGDWPVK